MLVIVKIYDSIRLHEFSIIVFIHTPKPRFPKEKKTGPTSYIRMVCAV